jgi:membrane-bound serine protease (ClpP class)
MEPLFWPILLVIVGLVLVVLEIFIPSGGILGFLAITSLLVGVVLAFYHYPSRPWIGIVLLSVTLVGLPSCLIVALHYFPNTPIGRRIVLRIPRGDEVLPDRDAQREKDQLVGRLGIAKTKMLPSGVVSVEGRSIDAVSEGMPIDLGESVEVVEVRGNVVVVRRAEADTPANVARSGPESDLLSKPLEELGLDPLDDPLA